MDTFTELCEKLGKFQETCGNAELMELDPHDRELILDQLQTLQANRKMYEHLIERANMMDNPNCHFKTEREADAALQKQRIDLIAARQQITALQEEMLAAHDCLLDDRSDRILMELETFFTPKQSARSEMNLAKVEKLYETLGGVELQVSTEGSDVLLITCGTLGPTVQAELCYSKQKPPYPDKLSEVKMGYCPIPVDDLISRALECNSFASVIPDIQQRLQNSAGLLKEIEDLRKTSAIDWIPGEGCMKLMVGPYTCTLSISKDYPTSGGVKLVDVKGGSEDLGDEYHPLAENPTLSDWVEYMERHLGS